MPDDIMEAVRIGRENNMSLNQILELPNYLYCHLLEHGEIQAEIDYLHKKQLESENGNNS